MPIRPATVPLAPAPAPSPSAASTPSNANSPYNYNHNYISTTSTTPPQAAHTCIHCVKRKVKCDRNLPTCSSCIKAAIECIYQTPAPRARKRRRRRSDDMHERLARYERLLKENGIGVGMSLSGGDDQGVVPRSAEQARPQSQSGSTGKMGKLLSGDDGKSRYIDSSIWLNSGEANMQSVSEDDEEEEDASVNASGMVQDPVSGALVGGSQDLTAYHPSHYHAIRLWTAHIQNVEPLCKVLHIPTTGNMVETVSRNPSTATKAQECLLFAIYHFAVFSLTDEDCIRDFGQTRSILLAKYQMALRQALVNASWLKTTEMPVMQAFILFLISVRTQADPHTFWIWTGVAVRISQRMGLHRDGEILGLPPFEVQMRRRLFWQLLPLDGYAGQLSGTGISVAPDSWDTKQPLNINDDQIYPGMTRQPEEVHGATEMIFCLTKNELSNLYTRKGVRMKKVGATIQFRESAEMEHLIDEVESTIETKYLRYCDIVNPLHVLTMGTVRSGANAVRLRNRMGELTKLSVSDSQRRELCSLALRILETDCMLHKNPMTKRFLWHYKAFFLWDALVCVLRSLAKCGFFARYEVDSIWETVGDVYRNHLEILEGKQIHHIAVRKATLDTWAANPPLGAASEPGFITGLRELQRMKVARRLEKTEDIPTPDGLEQISSFDMLFGGFNGERPWETDCNLSGVDWMFLEQL
ncbi:hypothetical protein BO70DRAFT_384331 [Aspergillus heteromorphus CBS 117.55]|uniref:Zn(2)-C6 fungal-type domain-containing protein n=1 Tax=Aspergillus heteromorphus CBS 117.55 TaxID=1448321 RepID=A0A317X2A6_9EURO|nr:uncharacterized protein BO70DRAFT_384331 [Aspergillus heteromorphus CBS 117.55]PWY90680.1 hypothetical protein BO70DRAFT_384331 [Aspergillus heteromorphus CBS 117.55]